MEVGGYNESLIRNQDNDINQRLIQADHRLYYTHRTSSTYFGPTSWVQLLRKAYVSGGWNIKTLAHNRQAMKPYHFVPALFVIGVAAAFLLDVLLPTGEFLPFPLVAIPVLAHLFVGSVYSWILPISRRTNGLIRLVMPIGFLFYHLFYGSGILAENK